MYGSAEGAALIGLRRCHEAISVLEQAKQHIPEGYYVDYLNQSLAYMRVNDRPIVLRIYQQLSAKPETVLVKEPKVLRLLTLLGLMLEQPDQAEKFYRLYHQYYSNNVKFEARWSIDSKTSKPHTGIILSSKYSAQFSLSLKCQIWHPAPVRSFGSIARAGYRVQ